MKHTVVALFDRHADARQAAAGLAAAGFAQAAVHVGETAAGTAGPAASEPHPHLSASAVIEGGTGVRGRLMDLFSNLFGVEDTPHAAHYEEAVQRGGTLVSVHADDEAQAARARDALLAAGAVNIDDRVEEWRQGGWDAAGAAAGTATGRPADAAAPAQPAGDPDGRRWVAVHRQEASIGGVRVYGHAVAHGYDDYVEGFRADYATRYAGQGGSYDDYEPAYRYGHGLASDSRYGGRDWADIEADARSDWERRHPGGAWERFKGAVRHAWERATS